MSYDVPDPNDLLKCPYDNTHMVVAKRFPYHLMKCRKNYTGRDFAVCPFHAYHEVPRPELRHHMLHCPYRGMLHKDLKLATVKQEDDAFKGNTSVPAYKPDWHQDPNEETWDEEPFEPYIPQRSVPSEPPMPQMRLPREAPQVLQQAAAMPHQEEPQAREQPTKVFNYSLSMAGIGRGRRHKTAENPGGPAVNGDQGSNAGKSGRGRIAANIYGGLQQETNGTANQAEQAARPVPIGRGRGRGLGRGLAQPNGPAVGAYAMQNGVPNR